MIAPFLKRPNLLVGLQQHHISIEGIMTYLRTRPRISQEMDGTLHPINFFEFTNQGVLEGTQFTPQGWIFWAMTFSQFN